MSVLDTADVSAHASLVESRARHQAELDKIATVAIQNGIAISQAMTVCGINLLLNVDAMEALGAAKAITGDLVAEKQIATKAAQTTPPPTA